MKADRHLLQFLEFTTELSANSSNCFSNLDMHSKKIVMHFSPNSAVSSQYPCFVLTLHKAHWWLYTASTLDNKQFCILPIQCISYDSQNKCTLFP